jgi:hypothetical protein
MFTGELIGFEHRLPGEDLVIDTCGAKARLQERKATPELVPGRNGPFRGYNESPVRKGDL